MTPDWLRYSNQGAIRSKPLSGGLLDALSFLPDLGVQMEVFSGGQAPKGSGGPRTGSTRHDHGNAADAFFYKDGRRLDWSNPADVPIFQSIVKQARANGVTGIGAGDGYMQPGSMHIGFGKEAVWGAGGKGANAPDWLSEAYHGHPNHKHQVAGGAGTATAVGGLSMTPSSPPDTLQGAQMQPNQQSTGLLGRMFPNMEEEQRERIRYGLANLGSLSVVGPNTRVMDQIDKRRDTRQQDAKLNHTIEWLAKQPGGEQYAQAIASGALPAAAALQMWQKASAGPDQTALQQQYAQAVNQGYQGTLMDYQLELKQAGASKTTVNTAPTGQRHGTIPQGYTIVEDPQSEAGYRMVPIPGGPEDQTAKTELANEGTRRSGDVVIEDIDRVIAKMDDGGLPVAGMGGGLLSNVPGTDAHDASKLLQTIRANVGFDRLQQMRDSSPTGGALGAINQSEMTLLNSALGSLEQSQSPEQFRQNLERLRGIYEQIVHGAGGQVPDAPAQQTQPLSDEDLLRKYGGN
jgi:hypothetical protein